MDRYTGTKALYLGPPPAEPQTCSAEATMEEVAGAAVVRYQWAFEGQPQDGVLLFHRGEAATGAWTDTFHQAGSLMFLHGETGADGVTRLCGTYPAPPGPDWGWRIEVQQRPEGLSLQMFNITPDGQEAIGVDAQFAPTT